MSVHKNEENVTSYDIFNKMKELIEKEKGAFYPFEDEIKDLAEDEDNKKFYDITLESDEVKWYEHAEDMCKLSEALPSVIFQLEGEGEENGDLWKAWYKDGRQVIHQAEIVIKPLDENEFKW
jgi:hypothetical protein